MLTGVNLHSVTSRNLARPPMRRLRCRIEDANRVCDLRLIAGEAAAASAMDRSSTRLTLE